MRLATSLKFKVQELTIEAALRKPIREVLPYTTNILCTRHLRNNVIRYLQDNIGVTESDGKGHFWTEWCCSRYIK